MAESQICKSCFPSQYIVDQVLKKDWRVLTILLFFLLCSSDGLTCCFSLERAMSELPHRCYMWWLHWKVVWSERIQMEEGGRCIQGSKVVSDLTHATSVQDNSVLLSCDAGYIMVRDDSGSPSAKILDSCRVGLRFVRVSELKCKGCVIVARFVRIYRRVNEV